ncbi:MAG TPA: hypothetical protein VI685_22115 [Candidatus Angelobacter sp.]
MRSFLRSSTLLLLFIVCTIITRAQQPSPDPPAPNLALQAIGAKGKPQPTAKSPDPTSAEGGVAEVARQLRGQDLKKVRVSPEEAEKILNSVQPVLRFASRDTGFAIHSSVKSRMISRNDMRTTVETRKTDDDDARRLQAEELTLKKFGYVPRTFSTGKFVNGMVEELLAGYYDPRAKTISLLDWVAPEEQKSVLAHELTHALQDQNFNLLRWQQAGASKDHAPAQFQVSEAEALPESDARRAVAEGQAMIVLIDYQWMQQGSDNRLELIPGAGNALSEFMNMVPIPDTPVIHAAPVLLRDGMAFPYREGLVFELELLGKGRQVAFNNVFARPPLNTHEILHPDLYLLRQKIRAPQIPDLNGVLADKYEVVDSGGLGELDVRSMIKQYANTRLAENISSGWRGSAFLLVKRKQVPTSSATTADVALIYVSAWSSSSMAQHFARFYADGVSKRYAQAVPASAACQEHGCHMDSYQFNTEEGFVNIECRPNNLVLVTESFEPDTVLAVNAEILKANSSIHQAVKAPPELSSRYLSSPIFSDLRELWEERMLVEAARALVK